MIRDLSISTKVLMVFFISYALIVGVIGWFTFQKFYRTLENYTFTSLSAMREVKKDQMEYYFTRLRIETTTLAQNPVARVAAGQLIATFNSYKNEVKVTPEQLETYKESVKEFYKNEFVKRLNANVIEDYTADQFLPVDDRTLLMQYFYISSNPNPVGSKSFLNMANDGSMYSLLHGKFQDLLKDLVKRFSFSDMYLIDAQTGDIVYSVAKNVEFATNIKTGSYRDTNLAQVYNQCNEATSKDTIKFADFKSYEPLFGSAVAFIGAPLYDGEKKIAIVVFQLRINDINNFMTEHDQWDKLGLGTTGEVYLVGADYKMRSISRLFVEDPTRYLHILETEEVSKKIIDQMRVNQTTILLQEVNTLAVKNFLRGQTGTVVDRNYLNQKVLSSYMPLSIPEINWGIIVEKQSKEVFEPVFTLVRVAGFAILVILILLMFILYMCIHNLVFPIQLIIQRIQNLSTQKKVSLSDQITTSREDEMGVLATAFNAMTSRFMQLIKGMTRLWTSINVALTEHARAVKLAYDASSEIKTTIQSLEKISLQISEEVRLQDRRYNQLHDVLQNIKNSAISTVSPLSYIVGFSKNGDELVSQSRRDIQTISTRLVHEGASAQQLTQMSGSLIETTDRVMPQLQEVEQDIHTIMTQIHAYEEHVKGKQESKQLSQALADIRELQKDFKECITISEMNARYAQQINDLVKNRVYPIQEMVNSCSLIINMINDLGTSMSTMEQTTHALNQHLSAISDSIDMAEKLREQANTASAIDSKIATMSSHIHQTNVTFDQFSHAVKTIKETSDKIKKINEDLGKNLSTFV